MAILALDYGDRYIGIAITDVENKIPLRHSVIDQKKTEAFAALHSLITAEHINQVIVGVPYDLDGEATAQTAICEQFIRDLRAQVSGVAVDPINETLTSIEAAAHLRLEGVSRTEEHAEAARIMLADYLAAQQR